MTAFSSENAFEAAQRMAKALCSSNLVPESFRGPNNIGSVLIALEISQRLGASPLMIMQNLNVIHGRPSWSSQFIIAALNSCGRFSPLRYEMTGEGDNRTCIAWVVDLAAGERLDGPPVSIAIAKKEGWFQKSGSKWQTMPELMLRYRAAAFFGRLYAPDILMGMQSDDEVLDVGPPKHRTAIASASIPTIEVQEVQALPAPPLTGGEGIPSAQTAPEVETKAAQSTGAVAVKPAVPAEKAAKAKVLEKKPAAKKEPEPEPEALSEIAAKGKKMVEDAGHTVADFIRAAQANDWLAKEFDPDTTSIAAFGDENLVEYTSDQNWQTVVDEMKLIVDAAK